MCYSVCFIDGLSDDREADGPQVANRSQDRERVVSGQKVEAVPEDALVAEAPGIRGEVAGGASAFSFGRRLSAVRRPILSRTALTSGMRIFSKISLWIKPGVFATILEISAHGMELLPLVLANGVSSPWTIRMSQSMRRLSFLEDIDSCSKSMRG